MLTFVYKKIGAQRIPNFNFWLNLISKFQMLFQLCCQRVGASKNGYENLDDNGEVAYAQFKGQNIENQPGNPTFTFGYDQDQD